MITYENFIDGKFVASPDTMEVTNPSTEEVLALVPKSDAAVVDAAVAAARKAQPAWAALTNTERAGYLTALATKLRDHVERFATYLVEEQGKVRSLAEVEVRFTADYFDYMAGWARRIEGEVIPSDRPGETILLTYQPLGVVAGILPWNFLSGCYNLRRYA